MLKKFRPNTMVAVEPVGPVTEADPPIAIRATISYSWAGLPHEEKIVDGWALAWTRGEVLIVFRMGASQNLTGGWVRANQVNRRVVREPADRSGPRPARSAASARRSGAP